jgi:RimJ/RimL family protein N-acetyltransferase
MAKILIKGKRINLRSLRLSDADSIAKNINSKYITRYTQNIPYPYKKKYAVSFVRKTFGKIKKGTDYEFGIELNGEIVGGASLLKIKDRIAELGYWLGKRFWGKGYMTEAAKLITDYGFRKLNIKKICSRVAGPNIASQRVLEKTGFKKEGILRKQFVKKGKYYDEVRYGLLSEE